jgi:predicted methyltransferase
MKRHISFVFGVCLAALALPHATRAADAPAYVAQSVSDPGRPPADIARDPARKPAAVLAFAQAKPGQTIVDFIPGDGYYTRLLAKLVGPKGKVYALVPMIAGYPDLETLIADAKAPATQAKAVPANPIAPVLAIQNIADYANVTAIMEMLWQYGGQFALPGQVDTVFTADGYHSLHDKVWGTSAIVPAVDAKIFAALKPGGLFIVSDYAAKEGLQAEIMGAGFVLDGESAVLDHPSDDRTKTGNSEAVRFLLRFKKPVNAANTDRRPGKGAMDGYFGNTSVMNMGLQEAPPREERRHFYHADGSYQEFGLTNPKFPNRGDQFQEGLWFWDVAGHNCMLHQFPADERGFVVCHAATPFKKAGDRWSELRNGTPPATDMVMLPGLQPLSDYTASNPAK